jgi:tripartite-type tricarboxylate transporter receptor subunit TctC
VHIPDPGIGSVAAIWQVIRGERDVYALTGLTASNAELIVAEQNPYPVFYYNTERHFMAKDNPILDVPTVVELGYPELANLGLHRGAIAPPGMPENILKGLQDAFAKVMAREDVQERMRAMGLEPVWSTGDDWLKILDSIKAIYTQYKEPLRAEWFRE